MKDTITVNKLLRLGFGFKKEEDKYAFEHHVDYSIFDEDDDFVLDDDERDDDSDEDIKWPTRIHMAYKLWGEKSKDEDIIEFSFDMPVENADVDCTGNFSHIEMHSWGHQPYIPQELSHEWTIAEVYTPKTMAIVRAVINLWKVTAKESHQKKVKLLEK